MALVGWLRLFVLHVYPALILIFIIHGYSIIQSNIPQQFVEKATKVYIKPDILSTIIWIIISILPFIYKFKTQFSNTFTISLIFGITSISNWVVINMQSQFIQINWNHINTTYLGSLCLISTTSISFYKNISTFERINFEYSWFHKNYTDHTSIHSNNLKWIIYLFVNIILFILCFIYTDHCNMIFVGFSVQMISMIIPYFILFIPLNQKYDLYFNRVQIISLVIYNITFKIYFIINSFFDQNLISPIIIAAIKIPTFISIFVILPVLLNKSKNHNLRNIVRQNSKTLKHTLVGIYIIKWRCFQ